MSRDEKTRCQHDVWLGDHCYSCESVEPSKPSAPQAPDTEVAMSGEELAARFKSLFKPCAEESAEGSYEFFGRESQAEAPRGDQNADRNDWPEPLRSVPLTDLTDDALIDWLAYCANKQLFWGSIRQEVLRRIRLEAKSAPSVSDVDNAGNWCDSMRGNMEIGKHIQTLQSYAPNALAQVIAFVARHKLVAVQGEIEVTTFNLVAAHLLANLDQHRVSCPQCRDARSESAACETGRAISQEIQRAKVKEQSPEGDSKNE